MAPFAHCEVAKKRHQIRGAINQQHAAQANVVVRESDNRSGDQPATLYSCEQKSIGVDELFSGSEFLDQSSDGRPEHPKTRRHQRVHEIEFPNFYLSGERQKTNQKNNEGTGGVERHDQPPPIFAIDEDAGEGQH